MFKRRGCLKKTVVFVLFLTIICGLSLITGSFLLNYFAIPGIRASKLENLPKAMAMANVRYINQSSGPLPLDVKVTDEILSKAKELGWSEYQIRAIIAAADATGVEREVLLAVAEMNDGWPSDIKANTYKKAVEAGGRISMLFVFLSVVVTMGGVYFYLKAMAGGEASSVVPLSYTYPLITFALVYFFLGESFTTVKFIGTILVCSGVFFLSK